MDNKGEFYYISGVDFFEQGQYEQAVENWIQAFELGYNKDVILDHLYQCFIIPNFEEFQNNYDQNNQGFSNIHFEDCVLDFIPVSDEKYYIFDKSLKMFQGEFCLDKAGLQEMQHSENARLYTDIWDIREIVSDKENLSSGILYLILGDMESRFVSFFKLPSFRKLYLEKLKLFHNCAELEMFLDEKDETYLPQKIISPNVSIYRQLLQNICKKKNLIMSASPSKDKLDAIKKEGKKNLLILKGQSQYGAMRRMADDLATAMRSIGYNTLILDPAKDDFYKEKIEMLKTRIEFDAVITFNAILMEKDIIRKLGKKFCALMGDHPLWHDARLKCADENTIVCYGDYYDADYVKRYYPNVGKVVCLGGSSTFLEENLVLSDRKFNLVFTGGYSNPKILYDQICQKHDGVILLFIKDFINKLINHPSMTYEGALWETLYDYGQGNIPDEEFRELATELHDVNVYVRSYYRDKIIRKIIENDLEIHVSGNGWEDFESEYKENLIIENNDWYTAKKMIANAKISLNIMPWFKAGFHDRAVSSMLSGTVLLTDSSKFIETNFQDMEELVVYHLENLDELPQKIKYLLSHSEKAQRIADKGREKALQEFTWEELAKCMVNAWFGENVPHKKYIEKGKDLSFLIEFVGNKRSVQYYLSELKELDEVVGFFAKGSTSALIGASDYRYIATKLKDFVQQLSFDFPEIEVGSYVWERFENMSDPVPKEIPELVKMEIGYLLKVIMWECMK